MSFDPVSGGGTVERTFQLSRSLTSKGHECTILTTDVGLTHERKKSLPGVKIIALPCMNKRFYVPRVTFSKLKQIVNNADVIHIMGHWTLLNIMVARIANHLNIPYVVCPAGALPIYGRSKILKSIYNFLGGRKLICEAKRLIAISPDEFHHFVSYGYFGDSVIIPNGIEPDDYQVEHDIDFKSKYDLSDKPFVLFLGRLNHIKGPDLLLEAFINCCTQLYDYHIVFAGPDEGLRKELEDRASDAGIKDRVHFVGFVGGDLKTAALHAADLLVIPSRQEAMSIVVLEAGVTTTPVLITNKCGFDSVSDVDGGLVVDDTIGAIAEGLTVILDSPEKLDSMGKKLHNYIVDNYLWDKIGDQHIQLYEEVLLQN